MISINTNPAASAAAYSLDNVSRNLQKTLQRLSSGSRIVSPMDDAGGLAVSMRLTAAIRRTEATQSNVSNAQSFLETQDGVLKAAEKVISRLGELTQLATDVTKGSSDLALYQTEVNQLKNQIKSLLSETFNGVSLFSTDGATSASISASGVTAYNIVASQDGTQTIGISKADMGALFALVAGTSSSPSTDTIVTSNGINLVETTSTYSTAAALGTASIAAITSAIQTIATLRANNGAEQSRLGFAADVLSINKTNLEAANSRILDVDIAEESAKMARFNILQQAGTAMLAQANQSTQSILRLLM
jgi:flagellin